MSTRMFLMIAKKDILIDRSYQRAQTQRVAKKIATAFSWNAFGVLLVSARVDGTYFALDGGTRLCSTFYKPEISDLPCWVLSGLTKAEEAKVFMLVNRYRKPLSGLELFASEVVAEDPSALRVVRVLKQHQLKVGNSTDCSSNVNCARFLEQLGDRGMLEPVLQFVNACWPDDTKRLRKSMLGGTERFAAQLRKHEKWLSDKDVLKAFQATAPALLQQKAFLIRAAGEVRGEVEAMCRAMVQHFNKGKTVSRISMPNDNAA